MDTRRPVTAHAADPRLCGCLACNEEAGPNVSAGADYTPDVTWGVGCHAAAGCDKYGHCPQDSMSWGVLSAAAAVLTLGVLPVPGNLMHIHMPIMQINPKMEMHEAPMVQTG